MYMHVLSVASIFKVSEYALMTGGFTLVVVSDLWSLYCMCNQAQLRLLEQATLCIHCQHLILFPTPGLANYASDLQS